MADAVAQVESAFAEAWLNLGLLREGSGQLRAAIDCYYSAVAARPDYDDALFNLALLLTRNEQYQPALPIWDRFLELKPGAQRDCPVHLQIFS